ncbi:hypothetical protein CR513_12226, partial [Mucuna pruriens]
MAALFFREEFIVHNDYESLKHLRDQHKLNRRHAKWVEFLEKFSYVIDKKCRLALGRDWSDMDSAKPYPTRSRLSENGCYRVGLTLS